MIEKAVKLRHPVGHGTHGLQADGHAAIGEGEFGFRQVRVALS